MSLKPTKKTDLGKDWLKNRESKSKKIMIRPEYHLIVTEGTKTEPLYFEAIKSIINNSYRDRISLEIEGEGDNTVRLFYKAKEIAESSPNGFKHVWIVYDTDDFLAEDINRTAELCRENSSEKTTYHPIWSNQCIELWYLLHFGYYQTDNIRTEYYPQLSEKLKTINAGKYKKNRDDMFFVLKPKMNDAIKNAKKLAKDNYGKTPSDSAPGTEVYQLIEKLIAYL